MGRGGTSCQAGWASLTHGLTHRSPARLAAPPAEGKANDELVRFLARESGVARGDIRIVRGASSRLKVVEVPDGFAV